MCCFKQSVFKIFCIWGHNLDMIYSVEACEKYAASNKPGLNVQVYYIIKIRNVNIPLNYPHQTTVFFFIYN